MNYLKFRSDQIFNGTEFLDARAVLVTSADGTILDLIQGDEDPENTRYLPGILSPGFVNCHCHLELSHMKGLIPANTGLGPFVLSVISKRGFAEEVIRLAMEAAEEEMIQGGIIAVGDICNNGSSIPVKEKNRLRYYNFVEVTGWDPAMAGSRFQASEKLYELFRQNPRFEHRASLVPHAPYSVSDELWSRIVPYFPGKTVSMHNQESAAENELFEKGGGSLLEIYKAIKIENNGFRPSGKTSLQTLGPRLSNAKMVLLVHNTFTTEADVSMIQQRKLAADRLFFCLCPNANLYIENRLPPVQMLARSGCQMVLGTDSLASNHQLSIWSEMVTLLEHFPLLSLAEILRWGTLNGAKALQMEEFAGSFERGKKPGIVHIDYEPKAGPKRDTPIRRVL
jgi:cytosine/adenosine deaminase-related metal-dependent hydrolase